MRGTLSLHKCCHSGGPSPPSPPSLAMVYTGTSATVKRILLKLVDVPVRVLGMDSADLLQLVLECPRGSETLVIRMLYILTETGEGGEGRVCGPFDDGHAS